MTTALKIYKTFTKLTDQVEAFLGVARRHSHATRLEVPHIKHAHTGLASSLEEYLNDPDFEINRRQFIAQKQANKGGKASSNTKDVATDFSKLSLNNGTTTKASPLTTQKAEAKGPAPDLIDLFGSLEQDSQPMMQQPQQFPNMQGVTQYQQQLQPFQTASSQMPQQMNNGFASTNPFASMVSQPQQNFNVQQQPQQQILSPFGSNPLPSIPQSQAASFQQQPLQNGQPQFFPNVAPQQQQQQFTPQFAPGTQLSPMATGQSTNPFRASMMPQQTASSPSSFSTSSPQSAFQSTNPFRSMSPSIAQNGQSSFNTSAPPSSTASFFSTQSLQSPQSFQTMPIAQPLQPTRTGTNPFKSAPSSAPASTFQTPIASPLLAQKTGSNPFRQAAFPSQQTGQGTMGGLENLDTIPVFPRPMTQPQQQVQQPWPS